MPINENAINAALAEVLSARGLCATPEATRKRTGAKRCDVQIRNRHDSSYYTALECKIGQSRTKCENAVKDAKRWLRQSDCWNAVALCYPQEIADPTEVTLTQSLKDTESLFMVRVTQQGPVGRWHKGSISDLQKLADDIGANETYVITSILEKAIMLASEHVKAHVGEKLASVLELPWAPKDNQLVDPRPARIACLILANMALLQNRMYSEGVKIPDLQSLMEICEASSRQKSLLTNWQCIRNVDYAPVVDPALAVLRCLPADHQTENFLGTLLEAVLECAPRIRGLQLDHAGPLYHGLLQTSKYDGSFYTSTSAAVLLAELAVSRNCLTEENLWADAADANKLARLKICDPACGTGTLLMACARSIQEHYRETGGSEDDLETLYLSLIEDVLYGLDINRHAIHLAACMLTLSAPKIDYNKMNLYNMLHGINTQGEVRAGSLDILVDEAGYLPGLAPVASQKRAAAEGYEDEAPNLTGLCDLVIMNPPFTRNDIRNRHLSSEERKEVQRREKEIAKKTPDIAHRKAINQSTIGTFFVPIADRLLHNKGALAIIKPFTACTNASGKHERDLLTDPERFHLKVIVTSHDNRRIYFSENTDIHECLMVAHRPTPETKDQPTAFISLAENPSTASEAHYLARAIRHALNGDKSLLADYGTIAWRSSEHVRNNAWNAACFYNQTLAEAWDLLLQNPSLMPIGQVASVRPEGRRVRDAFSKARHRQNPDMRALWDHKSDRQIALHTEPDEFLVAKPGQQKYAKKLWEMRSNLLLVNRIWLNLAHTVAVFSEDPILGSAFIPVTPDKPNKEEICKAWCVWLNSTPGIIAFLNIRQKKLSYPHFSLDGLRTLPVPNPDKCNIPSLAAVYDQYAGEALLPFPQMNEDPIRLALDEAVIHAVQDVPPKKVEEWRKAIPLEPSVNNKKEPFQLN